VTSFTSKFDAVLAGKAQFTTQEQAATTFPRQGAMQRVSPRRRPGEDPVFTTSPPQSTADRPPSRNRPRAGLCRESARVIFHRCGGEVGEHRVLTGRVAVTRVALRLAAEQVVACLLLRRELRLARDTASNFEVNDVTSAEARSRQSIAPSDRKCAGPPRSIERDEPASARRREAALAGRRPIHIARHAIAKASVPIRFRTGR